jgi:hypothetical protein
VTLEDWFLSAWLAVYQSPPSRWEVETFLHEYWRCRLLLAG